MNDSQEDDSHPSSEEVDDEPHYIGDRSQLLFRLEHSSPLASEPLSDEFFEVTKQDLMLLLNDLRREQIGSTERQLETKQLREERDKAKINAFKAALIRVCFPYDKLVLQAVFKPNDTIDCVIQLARNLLIDTTLELYLYSSPPRQQLNNASTLWELKLVPASLIYLGVKNGKQGEPLIRDEFKNQISSYKAASIIANDIRKQNQMSVNSSNESQTPIESHSAVSSADNHNTNSDSNTNCVPKMDSRKEGKIPKWFKYK